MANAESNTIPIRMSITLKEISLMNIEVNISIADASEPAIIIQILFLKKQSNKKTIIRHIIDIICNTHTILIHNTSQFISNIRNIQ